MSDGTLDAERDRLHEGVTKNFNTHFPNGVQVELMNEVRIHYITLAHDLVDAIPPGRDLSMALTDLETSQRCAIAAIAKNQEHYQ